MSIHARAAVSAFAVATLALAFVASSGWPVEAQPGRGFRDSDLRGGYAFAGVNCCVIGQLTADGAGNMSGTTTLADDLDAHHESIDCTYSIMPSGRGSMACTTEKLDGPDAGSTSSVMMDLVLADGGNEFFSIVAEADSEVGGLVGMAKRQ
jgi:hypothetical protein